MWVFFPAYGGGGEEFDFKFIAAWQNLEDQGVDYDQYSESGWMKAEELFRILRIRVLTTTSTVKAAG
jgi:hypothetical protein